LFIVSLLSIYEFRMGNSLFRPLLAGFFPSQNAGGWFTQMRWGFGRVAGPYGSAILMATIVGMGYLLNRWLTVTGQWERRFKSFNPLPISKSRMLALGLIVGLLMTLSRGPWLGTLLGLVFASVGTGANQRRALLRAAVLLVVGGSAVYLFGSAYLEGGSPDQGAEEQASAEYRTKLVDQYQDIAMQRPVWGWGRGNWPQVPGMKSIDNNYLLVALETGLVGTALFITMIGLALMRTFVSSFRTRGVSQQEIAFRFTMAGILAAIAISLVTVYLGAQLYPLLFLFLGWTEASVIQAPSSQGFARVQAPAPRFAFQRVVA
jgi:O-antigen ligase